MIDNIQIIDVVIKQEVITMTINKEVVSVSEAAALLGISSQTVYDLIHTGELVAYKDAGRHPWHIPSSAIEDYIQRRMNPNARHR